MGIVLVRMPLSFRSHCCRRRARSGSATRAHPGTLGPFPTPAAPVAHLPGPSPVHTHPQVIHHRRGSCPPRAQRAPDHARHSQSARRQSSSFSAPLCPAQSPTRFRDLVARRRRVDSSGADVRRFVFGGDRSWCGTLETSCGISSLEGGTRSVRCESCRPARAERRTRPSRSMRRS